MHKIFWDSILEKVKESTVSKVMFISSTFSGRDLLDCKIVVCVNVEMQSLLKQTLNYHQFLSSDNSIIGWGCLGAKHSLLSGESYLYCL